MKKGAFFVLALALLTLSAAIAPVFAIGPFGALDNDNPKFWVDPMGGVQMSRGEAGGSITWVAETEGDFWLEWRWLDASSGGGKIRNAIPADMANMGIFDDDEEAYANGLPTVNENKWIFMSPETSGYYKFEFPSGPLHALGPHGTIWWFFFFIAVGSGKTIPQSVAIADNAAAEFPQGVFWRYSFIG